MVIKNVKFLEKKSNYSKLLGYRRGIVG